MPPKGKIAKAKAKAWKQFSLFTRLRDSIKTTGTKDFCVCVTCGKTVNSWDGSLHAGHVIPGRTAGILFDEKGVNGQCRGCNQMGGRQADYTLWYIDQFGQDAFEDLVRRKNKVHRWDVDTLEGLADHYKLKYEELNEG